MPQIIVVPLDRSANAERALSAATRLARQVDASILLLSVIERFPGDPERLSEGTTDQSSRRQQAELEEYLSGIANSLDSIPVSTQVRLGIDPAMVIHATLEELKDPILIISSQGRSQLRRLVLGSVTTRIIQFSNYPVIIVPVTGEQKITALKRVVVALDGSVFAEYALNTAVELLPATDHAVHLLQIVEPLLKPRQMDADMRKYHYDQAQQYIPQLALQIEDSGYRVTWDIRQDYEIANAISTVARETKSDFITIATHGRTGLSRLVLGSVADAVVRQATIPVLLIRPPKDMDKKQGHYDSG